MSCAKCKKKNDEFYKSLGRTTKNPYGRFTENGSEKYIPVKDFNLAKEKGFFTGIEIEVL